MNYPFPPDVASMITAFMATGKFVSEDELLREALATLHVEQDDWEAIEVALNDMEVGDQGLPVEEAFAEIRQKLGLDQR